MLYYFSHGNEVSQNRLETRLMTSANLNNEADDVLSLGYGR
jgi:hypothetical protein